MLGKKEEKIPTFQYFRLHLPTLNRHLSVFFSFFFYEPFPKGHKLVTQNTLDAEDAENDDGVL